MSIFWQIVIALLVLNFLVMIHEFGHYLAARIFKVTIKEFAIGMGPVLLRIKGKHNFFTLRAFPIGGFLSMEGEDEASEDPNSFNSKKKWQRFIIVCAGAVMNLILGLILTTALVLSEPMLASTTVDTFFDDAVSCNYGLQEGDKLIKIDSSRIWVYSDAVYALTLNDTGVVDITVERNGEKLLLEDVAFATDTVGSMRVSMRDFYFKAEAKSFINVVHHSFSETLSLGKVIIRTLFDLVRGKYTADQVSGPVGTVEVIGEAASQGISALVYLAAFISVNLGIFNLLPLPALDGGRLFFIIIEAIRGKPVPMKYEGIVHLVGFILLIILIVLITFNDIVNIVQKSKSAAVFLLAPHHFR